MIIRHVTISGRVQGVGYRDWTARTAKQLGVEGWARNRLDGAVEAVFAGPDSSVAAMIEACRRGPASASVSAVDARHGSAEELERRGHHRGFVLLPTA
jgi:acylphosphatase